MSQDPPTPPVQDILDPLTEYAEVFYPRFLKVAEETFARMAAEAQVDEKANRETCKQIYATEAAGETLKTSREGWVFVCVLLWICTATGFILPLCMTRYWPPELVGGLLLGATCLFFLLIFYIHPRLRALKEELQTLQGKVLKLKEKAWEQMAPLNELYDWDLLARMMTQTVPRLQFDPYVTTQRLAQLEEIYGWDPSFYQDRSVIYAHSGRINGNPFVICRTRSIEMGSKTYYGHKTIYWSDIEYDSEGHARTVTRAETLEATVTAPYPHFPESTRLIYGNTAAPDLIFSRKKSGLAAREDSLAYRRKHRKLKRKTRKLEKKDYTFIGNEAFEVAFDTSDRNHNTQFALLFTPLAQENLLKLLKDERHGFGDDFDFYKERMINTLIPDHLQEICFDMDPRGFHHFDFRKAQVKFQGFSLAYFQAIYFSLAPLLCIPMYQQIRSHQDIYEEDAAPRSAFWEHEALANHWGQHHFKHKDCVTDCILKTETTPLGAPNQALISVTAHGFRKEGRLSYVSVRGGDGRYHDVPVHWDEYLPVTGLGHIRIEEDLREEEPNLSQTRRIQRIQEMLDRSLLKTYRRHIASKVY